MAEAALVADGGWAAHRAGTGGIAVCGPRPWRLDWLYHHLTISGPAETVKSFAATARGPGARETSRRTRHDARLQGGLEPFFPVVRRARLRPRAGSTRSHRCLSRQPGRQPRADDDPPAAVGAGQNAPLQRSAVEPGAVDGRPRSPDRHGPPRRGLPQKWGSGGNRRLRAWMGVSARGGIAASVL